MKTQDQNIGDNHEWQAQERALQDERHGAATSDDPQLARYRLVARALRQPLPHALPHDFAARVVAQAIAQPAHAPVDLRIEQRLVRVLLVLLALSAAGVVAYYGHQWLPAFAAVLPAIDSRWMLALTACVGLSWSFEWLRTRIDTWI